MTKNKAHQESPIVKDKELFLNNVADAVPALVAVYNIRTGEYIYVNKAVIKLLGYQPQEITKGGFPFVASLVHPEDFPRIMEENNQVLKMANSKDHTPDTEPIANFEYRMKHKDGHWVWLHTDGSVYSRGSDGKIEYILNVSVDITRRREAEEELKQYAHEKHKYAQTLTESIADAVIVTDKQFIIQSWNKGAEEMYGWAAEEVVGKPSNFLSTEFIADTREQSIETLNQQGYWRGEVIQKCKDGSKIPVFASVAYVVNDQGEQKGIIAINRDITEQKKEEKRKDDFIALVSHELKTPVTSLKIFTQVLENRFKKLGDTESVGYFAKMDKQLSKLGELVHRLLDVPRIQEGKIQFSKDEFELKALIEETIENVQRVTNSHRILFTMKDDITITADRNRIEQVLINLLNNAVKFSPGADKVIIDTAINKTHVTVSIKDYGVGILKEQQEKIFDRFYQADNGNNTYPGLGVGLFISKEIIERHDGKIWVKSPARNASKSDAGREEGRGSIFYFSLPFKKSS